MSTSSLSPQGAEAFLPLRTDRLPIFYRDCGEYIAFYAPGCLCVVGLEDAEQFEATIAPSADGGDGGARGTDWGGQLWRRAESAAAKADMLRYGSFRPECLTLYLNNECNLQCVYCYADPSSGPAVRLDLVTVAAAAETVADNCREKDLPLYLVFHGGGEPSLHRGQVESILHLCDEVASGYQIEAFRYIATNGVMSENKAVWLAHQFELIGLSCDGPADIHDRQRPNLDGEGTLHLLERTARIVRQEGTPFQVRATITRSSLHRQADIANYLCQQLSPREIRFEPVYRGGRADSDAQFDAHHAGEFVTHFLEARKVARGYGIPLSISGSRPDSIHGPYCNVFRQVLNLVPGGVATACFKAADASQARARGAAMGALNRKTGRFDIDHRRVQTLRQLLDTAPPECADCFNRFHCVRGCPDHCPLGGPDSWGIRGAAFRCLVQKSLTALLLAETAERLWSEVVAGKVRGPHGTTSL
jgi:sulfatase maturation enzyme AslB (radical SAM superfamily)